MDNRLFHGIDRTLMVIIVIMLCGIVAAGAISSERIVRFNHVETAPQRTEYLATHLLTGYPKTNEQLMEENGHFKHAKMKGLDVICFTLASCPGLIIKTKDYTILYMLNDYCTVTDSEGTTYMFNDQMTELGGCSKKTQRKVMREWNARLDQIGHRMNFQFNLMPWKDVGL